MKLTFLKKVSFCSPLLISASSAPLHLFAFFFNAENTEIRRKTVIIKFISPAHNFSRGLQKRKYPYRSNGSKKHTRLSAKPAKNLCESLRSLRLCVDEKPLLTQRRR